MRIQDLKEEFPWSMEQTESRSSGLHLSDVIHSMDMALMGTEEAVIDDATRMHFEKGYLWEVALSKAFAEKAAIRIGEIEADGIIMSPDGIAWDDKERLVLEEYKCTLLSSNKPIAEMWKWLMQVKGYCRALDTNLCIFRVLYLCGDYRNRAPEYKVYRIVFTDRELEENWGSILAQAEVMRLDKS